MADERTPPSTGPDGIEVQALRFSLEARDGVSDVMRKADTVYAATARSMEKSNQKIADSINSTEVRIVKSLDRINIVTSDHRRTVENAHKGIAASAEKMSDHVVKHHKLIEKSIKDSVDVHKKTGYQWEAQKMHASTPYEKVSQSVKNMAKAIEESFSKAKENVRGFVQGNKQDLGELGEAYEKFGDKATKSMDKTHAAVNKHRSKLVETGKDIGGAGGGGDIGGPPEKGGLFGSVNNLLEKIKEINVGKTALGAASLWVLKENLGGAERIYEIGKQATQMAPGGKELLERRRLESVAGMIKTGISPETQKEIGAQIEPVEAKFGAQRMDDLTEASDRLAKSTGQSYTNASKFVAQLSGYYGMTKKEIDETVNGTIALSKLTGEPIDNYEEINDQLKYMRFGLDTNAESAARLAESTKVAAAQMSKYGITTQDIVKDTKDIKYGGMDKIQHDLIMFARSGMGMAEAKKILNDVATNAPGAMERYEEKKNKAAFVEMQRIKGKNLEPYLEMGLTNSMATQIGMSPEEMWKRAGAYQKQAEGPSDKRIGKTTVEENKELAKTYLTGSEQLTEAKNKGIAANSGTQRTAYNVALQGAIKVNQLAGKAAGFINGLGPVGQVIGSAIDIAAAATAAYTLGGEVKKLFFSKGGGGGAGGAAAGKAGTGGKHAAGFAIPAAGHVAENKAAGGGAVSTGPFSFLTKLGIGTSMATALGIAYKTLKHGRELAEFAGHAKDIHGIHKDAGLGGVGRYIKDRVWDQRAKFLGGQKIPAIQTPKHWESEAAKAHVIMGEQTTKKATGKVAETIIDNGATQAVKTAEKAAAEATGEVIAKGAAKGIIGRSIGMITEFLAKIGFGRLAAILGLGIKAGAGHAMEPFMGSMEGELGETNPSDWEPGAKGSGGLKATTLSGKSDSYENILRKRKISLESERQGGRSTFGKFLTNDVGIAGALGGAAQSIGRGLGIGGSAEKPQGDKKTPESLSGLLSVAQDTGMRVTATTGGTHHPGSKHYLGQAIDVGTTGASSEQQQNFISKAQASGFKVLDERSPRPYPWSGPHLHAEIKGGSATSTAQASGGGAPATGIRPQTPNAMAAAIDSVKAGGSPAAALSAIASATGPSGQGGSQEVTVDQSGVIAELRKTNALLAQQLTAAQRSGGRPPAYDSEFNRGGSG